MVREYFGLAEGELDREALERAVKLETMTENESYVPSGERLVGIVMERGELFDLIRRFRQNFLDTLEPAYISDKWSIDYDLVM